VDAATVSPQLGRDALVPFPGRLHTQIPAALSA